MRAVCCADVLYICSNVFNTKCCTYWAPPIMRDTRRESRVEIYLEICTYIHIPIYTHSRSHLLPWSCAHCLSLLVAHAKLESTSFGFAVAELQCALIPITRSRAMIVCIDPVQWWRARVAWNPSYLCSPQPAASSMNQRNAGSRWLWRRGARARAYVRYVMCANNSRAPTHTHQSESMCMIVWFDMWLI